MGNNRVEVEAGVNPVTINNNSQEVKAWVYSGASPVVLAPCNGFLNVTAIIEVINTGDESLGIDIALSRMDGNKSQEQGTAVTTTLPQLKRFHSQ